MRIENVAEPEVAVTKLNLLKRMAIYIGNTQIQRVLDFDEKRLKFSMRLRLTLENNPYLEYEALTIDGKPASPPFYVVFEIRGRGLKSFRGEFFGAETIFRNLPENFAALKDCQYLEMMEVRIEGSMPAPCYLHPDAGVVEYSLKNVHRIDGRKLLDPKAFCQTHYDHEETYIHDSEVILPVGCFSSAKDGVRQSIHVEMWNLQKGVILDISCIVVVNTFHVPFDLEGKLDKLWKSGSAQDCKQFCFINQWQMTFCDKSSKNESTLLCAFCLRNKFGKEGDRYMVSVCNYHGPMTLQEKLQPNDGTTEEGDDAVDTDIHPENLPVRPSRSPDFKSLKNGLSFSLILRAMELPVIFE